MILNYALSAFCAALLFVWSMPKTSAVRYILLSLALITLLWLIKKVPQKLALKSPQFKTPLIIFTILTMWICFQAIFLSDYTSKAFSEITGQWLMAILAGFLGYGLAKYDGDAKKWIIIIACVFGFYVFYTDIFSIRIFLQDDQIAITQNFHLFYEYKPNGLPSRVCGLTDGMDKNNYVTNMFFAILSIEVFYRAVFKKRILPIDNFILFIGIIATLFSSYLQAVRNGALAFFTIGLGLTWLTLYYKRAELGKLKFNVYAIVLPAICIILALGITLTDKRWQSLLDTVPIALDTTNNKAWINADKYPYPKLSNGEEVSASNYERIAWIKEGFEFSLEKPFGYGYDRNAFGWVLKQKFPDDRINGGGHAHSAIIDFLLGVGFVGVALWLAFIVSLLYAGVSVFRQKSLNFSALLLILLAGGFFFRSLLDSNMRDHNLEEFAFLCLLMLGLSDNENSIS